MFTRHLEVEISQLCLTLDLTSYENMLPRKPSYKIMKLNPPKNCSLFDQMYQSFPEFYDVSI